LSTFARSFRHLRSDNPARAAIAVAVGGALLILWGAWFTLASVPVRVGSRQARIEAGAAAHSVDAPVAGRVLFTALTLGRDVESGEVLVRLEDDDAHLRLEEERARLDALSPQADALRAQMTAEEAALADGRSTTGVAVAEAEARRAEAETAARIAAEEATRAEQLQAAGQISEAAARHARAEADAKQQAAKSLGLSRERTGLELRASESDRRAHVEGLRADLARLEGELATSRAAVSRLEQDAGRRAIAAPVAGRIASVGDAAVGTVVEAGDVLATIVPSGELRAVAQFDPSVSLGRLHADQPARLRLDGFPWTQYGSVPARVTSVASEPREGLVRVEMELSADPSGRVPLEHGMTGRAEIEVERVTPLVLVLRAAGRAASRDVWATDPAKSP
jgi:membrane fusion protein (multidrug efflux system)